MLASMRLNWSLVHLALADLFFRIVTVVAISRTQENVVAAPFHIIPPKEGGHLTDSEKNSDTTWLVDDSAVVVVNNTIDAANISLINEDNETLAAEFADNSKRGLDGAFSWAGDVDRLQDFGELMPTTSSTSPLMRTQGKTMIRELFDIRDPQTREWHQFATRSRPRTSFDLSNFVQSNSRAHRLALLEEVLEQVASNIAQGQVALSGAAHFNGTSGWSLIIASNLGQVIPLTLLKLYLRAAVSDPKYANFALTNVYLYSRTGVKSRKQVHTPISDLKKPLAVGLGHLAMLNEKLRDESRLQAKILQQLLEERQRVAEEYAQLEADRRQLESELLSLTSVSSATPNSTTSVMVTYGATQSPVAPLIVDTIGPDGAHRLVQNSQVDGVDPFETRSRRLGRRSDDEL